MNGVDFIDVMPMVPLDDVIEHPTYDPVLLIQLEDEAAELYLSNEPLPPALCHLAGCRELEEFVAGYIAANM